MVEQSTANPKFEGSNPATGGEIGESTVEGVGRRVPCIEIRLEGLPTNIRLGWKSLLVTNTRLL
jgi:hypothetical protein